jgi:hypothetical protein
MGTWLNLTLVDLIVLLAVAVVLPLALGRWWAWSVAAAGAALSLGLDTGPAAAALALPWLAAAGAATVQAAGRWWVTRSTFDDGARAVAGGWAFVAGLSFLSSRLGLMLFGVGEPIVELTAVHYSYAGCAALVLAIDAAGHARGTWRRVGRLAVAVTAVAPAVVGLGFVSHDPLAQVGGAAAMAAGVWATASIELHLATRRALGPRTRALLAVSGAVIWLPMLLAVAWAAGQYWDFPALSIPAMERTHGVANSLGFVLAGLGAWTLEARRRRPWGDDVDGDDSHVEDVDRNESGARTLAHRTSCGTSDTPGSPQPPAERSVLRPA